MITFVRAEDGDWEGCYQDGVLCAEGHQVSIRDVLDIIGIPHEVLYADEACFDKYGGYLPSKLEDVTLSEL